MHIEHAVISDLPRIMEIYACARRFMAENGNPRQWGPTNWPPESLIRLDIEAGNLYVCLRDEGNEKEDAVEGVQKAPGGEMAGSVCTELTTANRRVVAVFFYIAGADIEPCYAGIEDGAWLDPSPYGVVHRIASDGSVKGAGSFCIRWAYEQCGHLRIDTHPDNKVMQGLLAKLGFRRCGIIHVVEDHDPRYAYELTEIQRG